MTEDSNEKARSFLDDMLGSPAADIKTPEAVPVVEAPAPEEVAAAPLAETAAAPSAEVKTPVVEAPKKRIREAAPAVDYERLAATTAKAVAEAIRPPVAPVEKLQATDEVLPDAEKRRVTYLSRLEKTNPAKYAGISGKYESSYKEVTKYQKAWEAENPGEAFDSESDAHADFLNKHVVDWDDDDYSEAIADEKIEATRDKARAEHEEQERHRAIEPQTRDSAAHHTKALIAELDPLLKDIPLDDTFQPLAEELAPVSGHIVAGAAKFAAQFISTSNRLFAGIEKYDATNPVHKHVERFASEKEQAILSLPKGQQLDGEGRPFVAPHEFYKMSEQDRDKSWTLRSEELAFLARNEIVADARKAIAREEVRADRLKKHWSVPAQKQPSSAPAEVAPDTTPDAPKPISPSGGLDPKLAGVKGDPSDERSIQWNSFRNSLLGVK